MGDVQDAVVLATEFIPPSVQDHPLDLHNGFSYSHYSHIPSAVTTNNAGTQGTPVVLGVDEAGRGPVIGPMVYGIFYLPIELQHSLLAETHHFDDSKVLTPLVRAKLMKAVCTPKTDLFQSCGWAVKSLSAQDIGAGMFKNGGAYNLNAQAMDATIELIRGVIERGVNVQEIYVDTIGQPAAYQKKLERIFPTVKITVEKKADSLFPCVSAASVVAKVTRDVSCEVLYSGITANRTAEELDEVGWGSGYPSDSKCVTWLKGNMDGTFGWGPECRFSWGTVKDMLELQSQAAKQVEWLDDDKENNKLSQYFGVSAVGCVKTEDAELRDWYGASIGNDFM
ncbi:hypothetical protein H2198_007569 [Neophaeococcomyces mojaviensis]|uniref:Uncharacterized protein n=2 Tax=Neophaeococcomyces mojaviensis TaxID=3383035 RepID=A0ACC2ZUK3_9EURO|nr:hypothetical protein H2198_009380 [Knufia sp. JES_112]KAJ9653211.1 hypothetical protein H2198_007569 [Knufia sp. JES_112]